MDRWDDDDDENERKMKGAWGDGQGGDGRLREPVWRRESRGETTLDQEKVAKADMDTDYGIRTYKQTLKKGDKDTFYCTVCKVELNSRETRQSHIEGSKHRVRCGGRRRDDDVLVRRIPNPPEMRKKIPERLEKLVRRTKEPIVGLRHVSEFLARSNDEMEPHYECDLCENQGEANAMFNHILGREHRARFFGARAPGGTGRGSSWDYGTMELLKLATKNAEDPSDAGRMITKVVSDAQYPWPAGKAPWSIEQGGDGQAPKNARSRQCALADSLDRKVPLVPVSHCGQISAETLDRFLDYGSEVAMKLLEDARVRRGGRGVGNARNLEFHFKKLRESLEDSFMGARVKGELKAEKMEVET